MRKCDQNSVHQPGPCIGEVINIGIFKCSITSLLQVIIAAKDLQYMNILKPSFSYSLSMLKKHYYFLEQVVTAAQGSQTKNYTDFFTIECNINFQLRNS